MTEQLRTPKDVAKTREQMHKKQKGIDPILGELIELSGSVLDHDHDTQYVRGVLHRQCNVFEGRLINSYIRSLKWVSKTPLPEILRNLALYYEQDYSSNALHPGAMRKGLTEFRKLTAQDQNKVLIKLGCVSGNNKVERERQLKKAQKLFSFSEIMKEINGCSEKSQA